jgi:phage recombination protein Bet
MSNLAVIQNNSVPAAGLLTQEQIDLVKRTVAKEATNDELQMFLYLAQKYGLDPFKKEIWFIKRAKKVDGKYDYENADTIIMTSRDGYLKIAQSDPDFDGLKSFVVREGDHFEIDAQTDQITHKFGAKRGKIIGAWAVAYHKKRRPVICFVDIDEYRQSSPTWSKYPSAMIQKVAEVFVLKRQFAINGLVTQEEIHIPDFNENNHLQSQTIEHQNEHQHYQRTALPHPKAQAIELMKKLEFDWNALAEVATEVLNRPIKKVISDIKTEDEWRSVAGVLSQMLEAKQYPPHQPHETQEPTDIEIDDSDLPF